MRVFSLSHFPLRCDQTDVEIELSSQSYVDSTIFQKKYRMVIGFVGILDAFEQIVKYLGHLNKRSIIIFCNLFSILRFAPTKTNLVRDFERPKLFYDLLRRESAAWRGLIAVAFFLGLGGSTQNRQLSSISRSFGPSRDTPNP